MKKFRNPLKNLTVFEWILWIFSISAVTSSFFIARNTDYWTLASSLIGVTSLIFTAKGDVFGLFLILAFSLVYAFVSFCFGYYGETIIYLFMQFPICCASLVSWLKNPADKDGAEVKIGTFRGRYALIIAALTVVIAVAFYFILRAFNTANLIVSTISVATSFIALSLMVLRLPAYAAAYVLNDVVLIVLWSFACAKSLNYVPMVVCFCVFLINDAYSFINWSKRKIRQSKQSEE